ncbi:hypothetical protein MTCOM_08800 [Moorella thermoacetica]|nr:hypothetical protein MOTHA_c09860 [Moorella thermoacetica]APC08063.1 hypothetical protein MTJW_08950 [Moorella thermoacetica]
MTPGRPFAIIYGVNVVKIGVGDLKARPGSELEFSFKADWGHLTTATSIIPVLAPVLVRGKVINTGRVLLVQGQVATTLELTCDRCLAKFNFPVIAPLEEAYVTKNSQPPGEDEEEDREIRPLEGDILDLQPAVTEALLLALPMKWLCQVNCRGLCPHCGQNLNEGQCHCQGETLDPRLATLGQFLRNLEGEDTHGSTQKENFKGPEE